MATPPELPRKPPAFSIAAIFAGVALVAYSLWLASPAANAFNERVFGQYYTAGAILVILFHGLIFFLLAGTSIGTAVYAWFRKEGPRGVVWAATVVALVAPLVAINVIKGA